METKETCIVSVGFCQENFSRRRRAMRRVVRYVPLFFAAVCLLGGSVFLLYAQEEPSAAEEVSKKKEIPAPPLQEETSGGQPQDNKPAVQTSDNGTASSENGRTFEIKGFVENDNLLNTYLRQNPDDANKKNEIRNNLKIQYGTEKYYFRAVTNQYVIAEPINKKYVYADNFAVARNGRISGTFGEFNAQELYVNASFEKVRFRAGNQIFGWGTTDVFNPTSYFNPYDLRELLFKDDDELKLGVPSLSSMIFIKNYTLELVFTPVHVPTVFASENNFWAVRYQEGPFPIVVKNTAGMELSPKNFGYGARFGGTIFGIDTSVSAYYGPDREPAMLPIRTVLVPNKPVSVEVVPAYYNILIFGADVSVKFDKFVLQGEASYSPDKTAVVDQAYSITMKLPFAVKKTQAVTYAVGFNYFIPLSKILKEHEGTTVFTAEWMQTVYMSDGLMKPFLTDIIVLPP